MAEATGLTPDVSASVAYLRALEPEGPWLVVALDPDLPNSDSNKVRFGEFYPKTELGLKAWLIEHSGRCNIYLTSNLPRTPFRTSRKEAIEWLRVLHVDVDLPGDANDPAAAAAICARFQQMSPPPTAIVCTGGGYQAIWKLRHRVSAADGVTKVEARNTAIWQALKGDHCHDISRLLRLPGTVNVLSKSKRAKGRTPALAYLVEADWGRLLDLDRDPVPRLPEALLDPSDNKPEDTTQTTSGVLESLGAPLRKLIKSGDASSFNNDRSRLAWHVMCRLFRAKWDEEDITALCLNKEYGISAHFLDQGNPQQYVARNLARAKIAVAEEFQRHPRTNEIMTDNPFNIEKSLDDLRIKFSYDTFADRTWMNGAGPLRQYNDAEEKALWVGVRDKFGFLPRRDVWEAVITTRARRGSFHPVKDYLARVQTTWDGKERIGSLDSPGWLTIYGGAKDSPYTRAVGRLTLTAAVRRVRQPGCKFDEMLLLISPEQGTNKSTAVRTLAVNDDWFNDYVPLGEVGREVIEHVRGFWIIEASELAGLRTRELEKIKSFCSRQHDRGRMSYDRMVSDVARSCIFIGTTNSEDLFTDYVNRRFWPVSIKIFDIESLARDLDQIWAEAAYAEASGESIRLNPNLYPAAADAQDLHRVEDSWTTAIDKVLGDREGRIHSDDVRIIINKPLSYYGSHDNRRIGEAMRSLGFTRKQYRSRFALRWYYVRGDDKKPPVMYVVRDPITGDVTVCDNLNTPMHHLGLDPGNDLDPEPDIPFITNSTQFEPYLRRKQRPVL